MAMLPKSITLVFNGTSSKFYTKAIFDVGREIKLGLVEYDDGDESWDLTYGPHSHQEGHCIGGLDGAFEAVGQLLDSVFDLEGDDDEAEAEEEEEDSAEGRRWTLISKGPDCDVHAMEILRGSTSAPPSIVGCLVRTELWNGDDYSTSTQFIPGVSAEDLIIPAPGEVEYEDQDGA